MKEEFARTPEELKDLKRAMERMYDALGVNFNSFTEVMEHLDDLRVSWKPTTETMQSIAKFKNRNENNGIETNPVHFWAIEAKGCKTVIEAVRLYLESNAQQFPGVQVIKNRVLFLANMGKWK